MALGRLIVALTLAAVLSRPALAASFQADVTDQSGKPVANAVIALVPAAGTPPAAYPGAMTQAIIDQRDEAFVPRVTVIAPHGIITFRNSDTTRHHVYSFSAIKQFEFVLKPGEASAVTFDTAGVAAIGCNIHDQMVAYAFVSETPYAVITDAAGHARLDNLPEGVYTATTWHAGQRPGVPAPSQIVTLASSTPSLMVSLSLLPERRMDHHDQSPY